jgi:PAS domain S-box-containing protein
VNYDLDLSDYRALYENALDGVLLTAPDGRIFAANPAACRLLGMTEEEICQAGRQGVTDHEDERWGIALAERERHGHVRAQLPLVRGDGSKFIADVTSRIFTQPDGERRSCVIFRDVTEMVELIDRQSDIVGELFFGAMSRRANNGAG